MTSGVTAVPAPLTRQSPAPTEPLTGSLNSTVTVRTVDVLADSVGTVRSIVGGADDGIDACVIVARVPPGAVAMASNVNGPSARPAFCAADSTVYAALHSSVLPKRSIVTSEPAALPTNSTVGGDAGSVALSSVIDRRIVSPSRACEAYGGSRTAPASGAKRASRSAAVPRSRSRTAYDTAVGASAE